MDYNPKGSVSSGSHPPSSGLPGKGFCSFSCTFPRSCNRSIQPHGPVTPGRNPEVKGPSRVYLSMVNRSVLKQLFVFHQVGPHLFFIAGAKLHLRSAETPEQGIGVIGKHGLDKKHDLSLHRPYGTADCSPNRCRQTRFRPTSACNRKVFCPRAYSS